VGNNDSKEGIGRSYLGLMYLKKSETHVFIFHSEKEEPSSFDFFCAYELHSPRSTYQGMVESIYLQQAAADQVTSKEMSFWISVA